MPDKMLLIIINGERDKIFFKFFSSHRIVFISLRRSQSIDDVLWSFLWLEQIMQIRCFIKYVMPEEMLCESLSATLQCIGFGDEQRSTVVQLQIGDLYICAPTASRKLLTICEKIKEQIFSARETWLEYFSASAQIKYGSAQTFLRLSLRSFGWQIYSAYMPPLAAFNFNCMPFNSHHLSGISVDNRSRSSSRFIPSIFPCKHMLG